MRRLAAACLLFALLPACGGEDYKPPPPLPPAPTPAPPPPEVTQPAPEAPAPPSGARDKRAHAAPTPAREKRAPAPAPVPPPPAREARTPEPAPAAPKPTQPEPAAAPSAPPKSKVRVPSTAHVRVSVPSGLQDDLDRDPRMQAWTERAVAAIDRCYAPLREAGAAGTIEVGVIMHENERPSGQPQKLPSALTPMLACVTGELLRVKMPLFTGKEGARHTLKIELTR